MVEKINDRWSQLSLQQRADLIKLYADGGFTNLKEIKNHYNSFGDGGDITQSQQQAQAESSSFLRNWYSNPTTQSMLGELDYNDYNANPITTPIGKEITDPDLARKYKTVSALNTPVNYVDFEDNHYGRHTMNSPTDPTKNFIEINEDLFGNALTNTLIHEREHAVQTQMPFVTNTTQPVKHKLKPEYDADPYLDSRKEVRSRIMETRNFFNLDPNKRDYTPAEAAEMQKQLMEAGQRAGSASELNRLTPETMAGYLNYMASNNTQQTPINNTGMPIYEDNVNYAANGGKFKFKNNNTYSLYPKYGSKLNAKFAYDAGSRDPEAVGAVIPDVLRSGVITNMSRSLNQNINGNSNSKFAQVSKTYYDDGLYNLNELYKNDSDEYEHTRFGLPNEDSYHMYNKNGQLSDYYETDYANALGMKNIKTPHAFDVGGELNYNEYPFIDDFKVDYQAYVNNLEEQKDLEEAVETEKRIDTKFIVPKDDSERIYISKVNNSVKEVSNKELLSNLNKKSKNDIIKIQEDLAKEGFYDIEISQGKSKNANVVQQQLVKEGYLKNTDKDGNLGNQSITALQQMLVDKGYLPEFTEEGKDNIDGILGKRTRDAYKQYNRDYNIDGIAGKLTQKGYLEKEGKKHKGFNQHVSADGMVDECAKWVSKKYDTITGAGKQNGVFGNAWNMLTNIRDAGGKMLFNLYDSPEFDSVTSAAQVKKATDSALKNNNIDYSTLLEGDVVGIYNPSSTHYKDVLDGGTTYNTHVGIVVDIENGIPIVEHNILGKVRRERIDKLTGSAYGKPQVTVASRPKQGESVQQLQFKDGKSKYELPEGKENSIMRQYMDSLASSKETFKNIFKNVDLDFIEEAAIAITKRETDFMNNKPSDNWYKPSFIARNTMHFIEGTPEEIKSQDLTKMKFNSLSPSYRASIGLVSPDQLSNDPVITGRAVMLLLSKNYDYFTRLAKQNPDLGLTKEDIENATILSYNRGLGKTHTMGFNEDGSLNTEELKYLRESSKLDAKEKDITATNLKYLNYLGEKAGKLGEWYYDKYGEPHTPYISRARQTMTSLKKK